MHTGGIEIDPQVNAAMDSSSIAIKYPHGVLQLNGNLRIGKVNHPKRWTNVISVSSIRTQSDVVKGMILRLNHKRNS